MSVCLYFQETVLKSIMAEKNEADKGNCDSYVANGLKSSPTIQFLIKNLGDMGCSPPEGFIRCLDCEGKPVSGGFGMLQEESLDTHSSNRNRTDTRQLEALRNKPDCTRSRQDILDQFPRERDGKS